jgi:hypothetical protein
LIQRVGCPPDTVFGRLQTVHSRLPPSAQEAKPSKPLRAGLGRPLQVDHQHHVLLGGLGLRARARALRTHGRVLIDEELGQLDVGAVGTCLALKDEQGRVGRPEAVDLLREVALRGEGAQPFYLERGWKEFEKTWIRGKKQVDVAKSTKLREMHFLSAVWIIFKVGPASSFNPIEDFLDWICREEVAHVT